METQAEANKASDHSANTTIDSFRINATTSFHSPVTVIINQGDAHMHISLWQSSRSKITSSCRAPLGTDRELLESLLPCDFVHLREERRLTRVSVTYEWITQEPEMSDDAYVPPTA